MGSLRHHSCGIQGMLLCGLLVVGGCTSTSGLLFRPGPHKLLTTAEQFSIRAGRPASIPSELSKGILVEYRVEPGDVLSVETTDTSSALRLPVDQPVLPDGTIQLGTLGSVSVAGRTTQEITQDLQRIVAQRHVETASPSGDGGPSPGAAPSVSVRLVEQNSKVFYVLGEVNAPGSFTLEGRETVLDAILKAGGLTDRANRHKILLTRPTPPRGCREVLPICFQHIVQLGDTSTNYQVRPGDRIFVASLTFCDELQQTLAPSSTDVCPRCADRQVPCSRTAFFRPETHLSVGR